MGLSDERTEVQELRRQVASLSRMTRLLGMVMVVTIVVTLFLGASAPDDTPVGPALQARSFELVDDKGRVRAELTIDDEGAAGLFVRDEMNRVRTSVTHDKSQSALFISDEDGQVRIGVAQFAHGGGGVALHGAHGKGGSVLYHKGTGSLSFYDGDGKVTTRVPSKPE